MTWYKRSDYGANLHEGANRNNAQQRGWGTGWPNCQRSKMTSIVGGDVTVLVRREIASLVKTLMDITESRYGYEIKIGQTWGYACRPIRGTQTPSNHSWGLAVDINSLSNPMQSTFKSDIPPAVVRMWEACGFYWGGRYMNRPDAMHFEYIGRPSDVARHTAKAKSYTTSSKPEGDDDMTKEQAETLEQTNLAVADLQNRMRSLAQGIYELAKGLADGTLNPDEILQVSRGVSGKID